MPGTRPHFPALEARGLDGWAYRLPEDFGGEPAIAVVAFRRRQQEDVDTWLPLLVDLEESVEGLRVYEIPCISSRWGVARRFIDGGMVSGIPDPASRARTLTTYTDVGRVLAALGLTGADAITVVLTGPDGVVRWQATGRYEPRLGDELTAALGVPRRP